MLGFVILEISTGRSQLEVRGSLKQEAKSER